MARMTLAGLSQDAARALLAVQASDLGGSVADELHAATELARPLPGREESGSGVAHIRCDERRADLRSP